MNNIHFINFFIITGDDGGQHKESNTICGKGIVYLKELIPGERRYQIVDEFDKPGGPIYINNILNVKDSVIQDYNDAVAYDKANARRRQTGYGYRVRVLVPDYVSNVLIFDDM